MKSSVIARLFTLAAALSTVPLSANLTAQEPIQHAPDGNTQERIQSIYIPAIPNAPFSAVVVTELIRILPDGSKQTTWNHRVVARDSSGRVFQERRFFAPNGNTEVTQLQSLQYEDPNQHLWTECTATRICRESTNNRKPVLLPPNASLPPLMKLPNGNSIKNEVLGHNTIDGVDVVGARETLTIPAGAIGNEKAEEVVKEFWYSPQLGINIQVKRSDPRVSSIQNFSVTQLLRVEPDPKLFSPPEGYKIIALDHQ
jgi:hypothetical protein